jgi:hypothetical protein
MPPTLLPLVAALLLQGAPQQPAAAARPAAAAKSVPAPATPAPVSATKPAEPAAASYLSSRLNSKPLPYADHATDDAGVQYLIEFDELILTLRPSHEFRASLRYRQTLASKGERIQHDPIQKMTVYGTWSVINGALHFTPDPRRGGSGLAMLNGTFAGPRIEVPFDYRNGSVTRRASVVLVRNDNII